jgi:hypothetical protein
MSRVLQEAGKVVLTYTCRRDLQQKWFTQYGVRAYRDGDI